MDLRRAISSIERALFRVAAAGVFGAACASPPASAPDVVATVPPNVPPVEVTVDVAGATITAPPIEKLAAPSAVDPEIVATVAAVDETRALSDVRRLAGFGTRHSLSDTKSETRGIGAATRWVKARFEEIKSASQGRLRVELEDFTAPKGPRVPRPWPMQNVLAILPGTATGADARTLVVSGHLDSRARDFMNATIDAPGANDDASGVAVVLEACRVMAPRRFAATIVFAAVTGEEQGLVGSQALAAKLRAEGARVEAMLTNDIVGASRSAGGRSDAEHVRVFSAGVPADPVERDRLIAMGGEADSPSRQLARAVREAQTAYVPRFGVTLVGRLDRFLRSGDHKSFHEIGVAAARVTAAEEDFRRQHEDVRTERGIEYGDVAERVDPAYLANVARVNVAALAVLGRAPPRPRQVRLDVRALDENTTLVFVPDPNLQVSYEVVARPTDSAIWTRRFPADRSGKVMLPISKDDWIFGLVAVGPGGHKSIAALALPLNAGERWPP